MNQTEAAASEQVMIAPEAAGESVAVGTQTVQTGLEVGDVVQFGRYEQDNISNGREDIEWIVLKTNGETATMISRYVRDYRQYHKENIPVTWETCTLRQWLNDDFLNTAFTQEEKAGIATVTVTADKNPQMTFTNTGKDTQDQVYLLSIDEVTRYFPTDQERMCQATKTAISRGVYISEDTQTVKWWLLRTPGFLENEVADVFSDGSIRYNGDLVYLSFAVRPVITLRLNA